jgi:hypothetical protein
LRASALGRGDAQRRAEMSSATLPNTLPAPTTAIFATNKSPIRSAGAVAIPLLGIDAPRATVVSLEPSPK